MNKFLFPILIALTACSPQNKIETSAAKPTETPVEKSGGDTVKMTGTVHNLPPTEKPISSTEAKA